MSIRKNNLVPPKLIEKININFPAVYNRPQLELLKKLAQEKGGVLLSPKYLGDKIKLRWKCQNNHSWEATPNGIKAEKWCPLCYGNVRKTISDIKAQAVEKGFTLISTEYKGTNKNHSWKCGLGHVLKTSPGHVSRGRGCLYCQGNKASKENNLSTNHPEIGAEWHPSKNDQLKPEDITLASNKKVWWLCPKGHEYDMAINNRTAKRRSGCPFCAGKRTS